MPRAQVHGFHGPTDARAWLLAEALWSVPRVHLGAAARAHGWTSRRPSTRLRGRRLGVIRLTLGPCKIGLCEFADETKSLGDKAVSFPDKLKP